MFRFLTLLVSLLWISPLSSTQAEPTPTAESQTADLAAHTVVVYNRADPDSQSLAETYAKARSIPPDRLLGIECPITEEITRIEFETKIREPLDQIFVSRGWLKRSETILPNPILGLPDNLPIQQSQDNPIWIMVLMRGVPLKIAEDPTVQAPETLMAQLRPNAAAVDSELALLPLRGLPTYGIVSNPYFADKRIRPFGQFFANYLIMVCRLDGPTPAIVRRMIEDAVETEKTELTGRAFFDIRTIEKKDDPYRMGDGWIEQAAVLFQARGFDIEIDRKPEVASKWIPWDQIAFYAGWYTWNFEGPFELPDSVEEPSLTISTPSAPIPYAPKPKTGSVPSSPTALPPPWAQSTNPTSALLPISASSSADSSPDSPSRNRLTNPKSAYLGW